WRLLPDTASAAYAVFTLSLHDALPISLVIGIPKRDLRSNQLIRIRHCHPRQCKGQVKVYYHEVKLCLVQLLEKCLKVFPLEIPIDRKSTRLKSSHWMILYPCFSLKKSL